MTTFPAIDPIPLPAPVWLFKILHILTLALHFVSVEMLLGGLAAALVLNLASRGGGPAAALRLNASAALARRLPIVMTYVINLGVPPLLFAQVLYGRALYTSSILIGLWWIAVIFLLIGCYWHIYRFTAKLQEGRRAWPMALISLALALLISRIYSTNMTLMLHPEAWQRPLCRFGHRRPTAGGGSRAHAALAFHAHRRPGRRRPVDDLACRAKLFEPEVRTYLSAIGGRMAVVALPVQIFIAFQVISAQPDFIRQSLTSDVYFRFGGSGLACWRRPPERCWPPGVPRPGRPPGCRDG